METEHPEDGESPFFPEDKANLDSSVSFQDGQHPEEYASCPVEGCGEVLLVTELPNHIELHGEEQDTEEDTTHSSKRVKLTSEVEKSTFGTKLSHELRNLDDAKSKSEAELPGHDPQASAKAVWKHILKMPETSLKKKLSPSKPAAKRRLGVC